MRRVGYQPRNEKLWNITSCHKNGQAEAARLRRKSSKDKLLRDTNEAVVKTVVCGAVQTRRAWMDVVLFCLREKFGALIGP